MSLTPRETHALREIAEGFASSDPRLVRMLREGPVTRPRRRALYGWRALVALLVLGGYVLVEAGLMRGSWAVTGDGVLLAALGGAVAVHVNHRAPCAARHQA